MALIDILTPDFRFDDDRGTIVQLVHGGYNQINAVFTKKNAVRGNLHYHKYNKETFYIISGEARVTAVSGDTRETYTFHSGDMFCINENVRHDFLYLEDTYLIGMYSGCVELENGEKDIYTD